MPIDSCCRNVLSPSRVLPTRHAISNERNRFRRDQFCTSRTLKKRGENTQKFGSRPVRRTALLSTFNSLGCLGFSHFWPIACPIYSQLSTHYSLMASLVSRPVSRQSRLKTLVFPGKTGDFAAQGVGFELVGTVRPKQPITPRNSCPARNCLILFSLGSKLACVIGCIGAVYRV